MTMMVGEKTNWGKIRAGVLHSSKGGIEGYPTDWKEITAGNSASEILNNAQMVGYRNPHLWNLYCVAFHTSVCCRCVEVTCTYP